MKVSRVLPLLACGLLVSACSKKSSNKKAPLAPVVSEAKSDAPEAKSDACPEINGIFTDDSKLPSVSISVNRSEKELTLYDGRNDNEWIISSTSENVTDKSKREEFPLATDYIAKCFSKDKILITYYAFPGSDSTQMGRKHVDGFLSDTDNRFILGSVEYSMQKDKIIVTTKDSNDEAHVVFLYPKLDSSRVQGGNILERTNGF
ncbi:MAG: hypothetical protein K1X29_03275 [Bdellovibrionales bacterium]|nr:hypothetical protein [Bdellovibrionales bacterium]